MRLLLFAIAILAMACACKGPLPGQLPVQWEQELPGDFSFANDWSYPEGVYRNAQGQLSCDGFCPERTDAMKDSTGRIYEDSLPAFYALVDTTHLYHSLACDAWCDEWAGSDFISARRQNDTVYCQTWCDAATHCSLHLLFVKDACLPLVQLHSIVPGQDTVYRCQSGTIRIDQAAWKKGLLKAEFDLDFGAKKGSGKHVSWKGRIYAPIDN